MDKLILALLVIALVIAAIVIIAMLIGLLCANSLVLADTFFGSWHGVPPAVSWAVMGFFIGAGAYLAIVESRRLRRPGMRVGGFAFIIGAIALSAVVGPRTGTQVRQMASPSVVSQSLPEKPVPVVVVEATPAPARRAKRSGAPSAPDVAPAATSSAQGEHPPAQSLTGAIAAQENKAPLTLGSDAVKLRQPKALVSEPIASLDTKGGQQRPLMPDYTPTDEAQELSSVTPEPAPPTIRPAPSESSAKRATPIDEMNSDARDRIIAGVEAHLEKRRKAESGQPPVSSPTEAIGRETHPRAEIQHSSGHEKKESQSTTKPATASKSTTNPPPKPLDPPKTESPEDTIKVAMRRYMQASALGDKAVMLAMRHSTTEEERALSEASVRLDIALSKLIAGVTRRYANDAEPAIRNSLADVGSGELRTASIRVKGSRASIKPTNANSSHILINIGGDWRFDDSAFNADRSQIKKTIAQKRDSLRHIERVISAVESGRYRTFAEVLESIR